MLRRSEFLAAGAAGAAAPAVPIIAQASPIPTPPPAGRFDRTAFEAVLARDTKHKQVFASTQLAGGLVLHYMENSLQAYAIAIAEGAGTLHAAAVLYGPSLALALSDAMWAKYPVGAVLDDFGYESTKTRDAALRAARANPYANRVAALARGGASFFVCNNALTGFATQIAERPPHTRAAAGAIHDDLATHLVDGAMLVPAGVYALNAAQEARFTYVQATIG